jgi:transcriptional regulator with XRE-family HTH domain
MPDTERRGGLIPALLKQWRAQRGLSQLDLALVADVSARHVSFLETGRSLPSAEMVLRLGAALGAPLGQVNVMLAAAGHDPVYDGSDDRLPAPVTEALELLKSHHEPYPLVVVDRTYAVRDLNRAALAVIGAVLGQVAAGPHPGPDDIAALGLNLARLTLDPAGAQPHLVNFADVGRQLLWRIQREVLADPSDRALHTLLDELLALPTVAEDWREVDLSVPSEPALVVHLRRDDLELRFLTTVTAFQAPQNVAVEQLRIEQWFPYDEATAEACRQLAAG